MKCFLERLTRARHDERGVSGIVELVITMVVLGIVMPMIAIGSYSIINASSGLVAQNTAFSLQSNATLNVVQDISSAQPAPYCANAPGSATSAAFLYATSLGNCQTPAQGPPVNSGAPTAPCGSSCSPAIPTPSTSCAPSNAVAPVESQAALVAATPTCIGFFSYNAEGAVSVPMMVLVPISANVKTSTISVTSIPEAITSGTQLTIQSGSSRIYVSVTQDAAQSSISSVLQVTPFTPSVAIPSSAWVTASSQTNPTLTPPSLSYFWVDNATNSSTFGNIFLTTYAPTQDGYPTAWRLSNSSGSNPTCVTSISWFNASQNWYTDPCWSTGTPTTRQIGSLPASCTGNCLNIFTYIGNTGQSITPYDGSSGACDATAGSVSACAASLASIAQATVTLTFANKNHQIPSQTINVPIKGNILSQI